MYCKLGAVHVAVQSLHNTLDSNLTPWINYPSSSYERNNIGLILLTCFNFYIFSVGLGSAERGILVLISELMLPQIFIVKAKVRINMKDWSVSVWFRVLIRLVRS